MTTQGSVQTVNINELKRSFRRRGSTRPADSTDLVTRMNCYEPGQITPLHIHPNDDEVVFCVEGRETVTFEELDPVPLAPGSLVMSAGRAGAPHRGGARQPDGCDLHDERGLHQRSAAIKRQERAPSRGKIRTIVKPPMSAERRRHQASRAKPRQVAVQKPRKSSSSLPTACVNVHSRAWRIIPSTAARDRCQPRG